MIVKLSEKHIAQMLELQREYLNNEDIFLTTSREGYLRAFMFSNVCCGYMEYDELIAFLNCSVPTEKAARNLGRGRIAKEELNRVGHMNTLLVRKGCRRHGIGRELVEAALNEFMRQGCRHIYALVSPANRASLGLLDSLGFHTADRMELGGAERMLMYLDLNETRIGSI